MDSSCSNSVKLFLIGNWPALNVICLIFLCAFLQASFYVHWHSVLQSNGYENVLAQRALVRGDSACSSPYGNSRWWVSTSDGDPLSPVPDTIHCPFPLYPLPLPCLASARTCCASSLSSLVVCTGVWSFSLSWGCLSSCWWTRTTSSPHSKRTNSLTEGSSTSTSAQPALAPVGVASSWMDKYLSRLGVAFASWMSSMWKTFSSPSTGSLARVRGGLYSSGWVPTKNLPILTRRFASGQQDGPVAISSRPCTRLSLPDLMETSDS